VPALVVEVHGGTVLHSMDDNNEISVDDGSDYCSDNHCGSYNH
jgi:hypothetical protein